MDNFDLRKYLAEGRLFEEDDSIGYPDYPESKGKPYAIDIRYNMLYDEDKDGKEYKLKTLDGKKDKTYVMFTTSYWDGETGYYEDIKAHHDYDKEKFGKIYDYEAKSKFIETVLDPETGKEMIQHTFMGGEKDGDYMEEYEDAWDIVDNRYFNTQEELINFDLEKLLKDINQKENK